MCPLVNKINLFRRLLRTSAILQILRKPIGPPCNLIIFSVQKMSSEHTDLTEDSSSLHSKKLFSEISNYLLIEMLDDNTKCKHCPDNFDCVNFNVVSDVEEIIWSQQDESMLNVTLEDLNIFFETHILKSERSRFENNSNVCNQCDQDNIVPQCQEKEKPVNNISTVISLFEKTCTYQAPKTLDHLLNKYSTSIVDVNEFSEEFENSKIKWMRDKSIEINTENASVNLLNFYKLNSLEDLFVCNDSEETVIYSPDIIDSSFVKKTNISENKSDDHIKQYNVSPVLCTFERARNIKNFQKNLLNEFEENSTDSYKPAADTNKPNLKKLKLYNPTGLYKAIDTPSKFSMPLKSCSTPLHNRSQEENSEYASQKINLISGKHETKKFENSESINKTPVKNTNRNEIDIDDICDLSVFGLTTAKTGNVLNSTQNNSDNVSSNKISRENSLYVEDICDLSIFGIQSHNQSPVLKNELGKISNKQETVNFNKKNSCRTKPLFLPSQTQISITQMIDLINTNEKKPTFVQKEPLNSAEMCGLLKEDKNRSVFSPKKKINKQSSKLHYSNSNRHLEKCLNDPDLKENYESCKEFKVPGNTKFNESLKSVTTRGRVIYALIEILISFIYLFSVY